MAASGANGRRGASRTQGRMVEAQVSHAKASREHVPSLVSEKMRPMKYPKRAGERMRASAALMPQLAAKCGA